MGNCFKKKKSESSQDSGHHFTKTPVVKLYGSPASPVTSYIRFALAYKPIALSFIPSTSGEFGCSETTSPMIQYGDDVVSGSPATLLHYADAKFPVPRLLMDGCNETTRASALVALQHRSMEWHVDRMVRWGVDLAARGGKSRGDPVMGTPRMEVSKFGKSYSQLLEVMLEHAQMEERIIFSVLDKLDPGISKSVNEQHARDLPIMNGIKEDMKAIGVVANSRSSAKIFEEALFNLSARLKTLKEHCRHHFQEEEREILSLMEAAEMSEQEQERVVEQCIDTMPSTHSHLFRFFIQGLLPNEAMLYLDLVTRSCTDKARASLFFSFINQC